MPLKKPPATRTPKMRAFKTVQGKPSTASQETQDNEEPDEERPGPKTRTINVSNAGLTGKKRKKGEGTTTDNTEKSEDSAGQPDASDECQAKKKGKKKPAKKATTTSTSAKLPDPDKSKKKTTDKAALAKEKPAELNEKASQPKAKAAQPKVKATQPKEKAAQPKEKAAQPKEKAAQPEASTSTGRKGVQVSKSGKRLTNKKTVGNQPSTLDPLHPDPIPPQDEADYFASSDDQREEEDPAMVEALREDADSSPLELEWVKRKFTPEEDDEIIEFVKSNPIFYNMKQTDFKLAPKKAKKLKELARKLRIPGEFLLNFIYIFAEQNHL